MNLAHFSPMPLRMTGRERSSKSTSPTAVRRLTAADPAVAVSSRDMMVLLQEIQRLQDENEALRGSAEIWIRMYEGQVQRARTAADACTCHGQRGPRGGEGHEQ
jgi:hypothetical protein